MADDLALSDMAVLEQTIAQPAATDVASADTGDTFVDDTPADVNQSIDQAIKDESAQPKPEVPTETPFEEAKPAEQPAQPAAEPIVDLGENLTIKSLNEKARSSPEFKALLDKDPAFKNQLFYSARMNERASQYDELFQTPALAREAHAAANDHYETRELLATDQGEFLKKLFVDTIEKDAQGNLMRDANGRYQTSGHYEKAMAMHREAFYGQIAEFAKSLGDGTLTGTDIPANDLVEAVKIFQAIEHYFGFGPAPSGAVRPAQAAQPNSSLPAEVQAQLKELEQIKSSQAQSSKQSLESFTTQVTDKVSKALESDIKANLDLRLPKNAAFSDYTKNAIVRDALTEVNRIVKANRAHSEVLNRTLKSVTRDEAGIQKVIDLERAHAREIYPRILAKLLSANTQSIVTANQAGRDKVTQQLNRREVATSGGVSTPPRQDVRVRAQEIEAEAKRNGKRLSDLDLVNQLTS